MNKRKIGDQGERLAADFLIQKNYRILEQNYYVRGGELDLICEKNDKLIFVEVKLRKGKQFGDVRESLTFSKLHKLQRAIWQYLLKTKQQQCDWQLDFVGIEYDGGEPRFVHIENISAE